MNARIVWRLVACGFLIAGSFVWLTHASTAGGPPIRLASGTGYLAPEIDVPQDWNGRSGLIPTHWEARSQLIPTEIDARVQFVQPHAKQVELVAPVTQFLDQQFRTLLYPSAQNHAAHLSSPYPGECASVAPKGPSRVTSQAEVATVPKSINRRRHDVKQRLAAGNPQQKK